MEWGIVLGAFAIGVGVGQLNAFLIWRKRLNEDRRLKELDEALKKRREEFDHVENDSEKHLYPGNSRDN